VERKWVGFVHAVSFIAGADRVLVGRAFAYGRDESLPNARVVAHLKWVTIGPPVIEVTDDGNPLCIGRPDCKVRSWAAIDAARMSAEFLIEPVVAAFVE
jgi:hypothetical protein